RGGALAEHDPRRPHRQHLGIRLALRDDLHAAVRRDDRTGHRAGRRREPAPLAHHARFRPAPRTCRRAVGVAMTGWLTGKRARIEGDRPAIRAAIEAAGASLVAE